MSIVFPPVPAARRHIGLAFAAASLLVSPLASADSVRIGSRLIVDGDTREKVLAVAGPPQSTHSAKAPPKAKSKKHGDEKSAKTECWVYAIDGKQVEITLRGGIVTKIVTGKARPAQAGETSSSRPRKTRKKSAP